MERGNFAKSFNCRHDNVVNQNSALEPIAAVHHAVPDSIGRAKPRHGAQPLDHEAHRRVMIDDRRRLLDRTGTVRFKMVAAVSADSVDDPVRQFPHGIGFALDLDPLKFERRTAAIEN
jgi:hypothetical protein